MNNVTNWCQLSLALEVAWKTSKKNQANWVWYGVR